MTNPEITTINFNSSAVTKNYIQGIEFRDKGIVSDQEPQKIIVLEYQGLNTDPNKKRITF